MRFLQGPARQRIVVYRTIVLFITVTLIAFVVCTMGILFFANTAHQDNNSGAPLVYDYWPPIRAAIGISMLVGLIGLCIAFLVATWDDG